MITAREQQMLDLAEGGHSTDAIAAAMGVKSATVSHVLAALNPNLQTDRAREESIRDGSRCLLAAQRAAGLAQ